MNKEEKLLNIEDLKNYIKLRIEYLYIRSNEIAGEPLDTQRIYCVTSAIQDRINELSILLSVFQSIGYKETIEDLNRDIETIKQRNK